MEHERAKDRIAALYALRDPKWRSIYRAGGWWLLVPVIGWPVVIGYRRMLVDHLFAPKATALPRFRGQVGRLLVAGWSAMAVIFGHLLPVYAVFVGLWLARGWTPNAWTLWCALGFVLWPLWSPLSLPLAIGAATWSGWIGSAEAALFAAAFGSVVFVVPSALLEVSRTGNYRSALRADRSIARVARAPRAYLRAWAFGLVGQTLVPFTLVLWPWALFHAYVATVVRFNQLLIDQGEAPGRGWLARAAEVGTAPGNRVVDGAGHTVALFSLGPFALPVPRIARVAPSQAESPDRPSA